MKRQVKTAAVIFILIFALSMSVSAECIALDATITASSEFAERYAPEAAIHEEESVHEEGIEWASAGEATPWIRFEWAEPVWIGSIIIADRANLVDWAMHVNITFSDGSSYLTGELENDGLAYPIEFEPKNVTWVQMDITESDGPNIGLGRISIYATDAPPAPPEPEPEPEAPAVVVEEAPPAPAPAQTAPAPAPRTADPVTLIALGSLISAAGLVITKKRK